MSDFIREMNWKTTLWGFAYIGCSILGWWVPDATTLCQAIEPIIVGAGFISSADSERVKRVVDAVDGLLGYKKPILPVQPVDVAPLVK